METRKIFAPVEQITGPEGVIHILWMSDSAPYPSIESLKHLRAYIDLRIETETKKSE